MAETPLPGPTAELLAHALNVSGKTQAEVARDVGLARPNVISMMKTGRTKIPLDRIPLLAHSLGVDERRFLRIALEEYHPELALVINGVFGELLSDAEQDLLTAFRLCDPDGRIIFDREVIDRICGPLNAIRQERTDRITRK